MSELSGTGITDGGPVGERRRLATQQLPLTELVGSSAHGLRTGVGGSRLHSNYH